MPYPSTVGSFTNPQASNKLNSPSHSSIETAQNTALTEIQTFVGTEASTVGTLFYDIRSTNSNGGGHIQTANKGGTGQTAYTKGDLLVATSSSVLAKLGVGSNSQYLMADSNSQAGMQWTSVVAIATLPSVRSVLPHPVQPIEPAQSDVATLSQIDGNISSMLLGQVIIPFNIVANRITHVPQTITGNGIASYDITMYTESGSSVFSVTTSVVSNTSGSMVTIIPGASITAGIYYIGVNGNMTGGSVRTHLWNVDNGLAALDTGGLNDVTRFGGAVINGTYPISPGVPATSIIPNSIASSIDQKVLLFRLDN